MVARPFSHVRVWLLGLALASLALAGCGKGKSNPAAPQMNLSAAFNGTWIGSLTGPDSTQQSGWSPRDRDSLWIVFSDTSMTYYMAPAQGADSSLSPPPDTCFISYPVALNSLADPDVSFRVNLFTRLHLSPAVPFDGVRNGTTLTGTMAIPGDSLGGHWSAVFCSTCPDTAKACGP